MAPLDGHDSSRSGHIKEGHVDTSGASDAMMLDRYAIVVRSPRDRGSFEAQSCHDHLALMAHDHRAIVAIKSTSHETKQTKILAEISPLKSDVLVHISELLIDS